MTSVVFAVLALAAGDEACESLRRHILTIPSAWHYGGATHESRVRIAEAACKGGAAECCWVAGLVTRDRLSPPADYSKADDLLSQGCALGSAEACLEFAEPSEADDSAVTNLKGLLRNLADRSLLDNCRRRDARACDAWLRSHYASAAPEQSKREVAAMLVERCSESNEEACEVLLDNDEVARGPGRDTALDGSCRRGHARSCGNKAFRLLTSTGDSSAAPKALELMELACTGGDGTTCYILGLSYDRRPLASFVRLGLERNESKALHYFEAACELEDVTGCMDAALKLRSSPLPDAGSRAKELLKRACDLGELDACQNPK